MRFEGYNKEDNQIFGIKERERKRREWKKERKKERKKESYISTDYGSQQM